MDEIEIKREEFIKLLRRSAWLDLLLEANRKDREKMSVYVSTVLDAIHCLTEREA